MKFSIREVMLVTVIVALAVGWHKDHRQLKGEIERTDAARLAIENDDGIFGQSPKYSAPAPNPPKP